jgi:hypothetical protein
MDEGLLSVWWNPIQKLPNFYNSTLVMFKLLKKISLERLAKLLRELKVDKYRQEY